MSGGDLEIREYRAGDEHEILRTFNLVFREVCGPSFTDRGLARWRWQFLENPAGRRIMLAVDAEGRVACQYAGIPVRVHSPEGEVVFDQAVDSMVHPDHRRGLRRTGIFLPTATRFFERFGFAGEDAIVYGYPVDAPWRIGERFFEQRLIREISYWLRPAAEGAADGPSGIEVAEVERFGGDADRLWERARAQHTCTLVRDARYLDWRYAACPDVDYVLLLARRGGEPAALAVLHPRHELVPGALTLADWLAPREDLEAQQALLAAATARARRLRREVLLAAAAEPSPLARFLAAEGFTPTPSSRWMLRRLGCRTFHPLFTADWLREHWSYTLGDSDLV